MKKAVIVENKGCATCSIGAACLVDGLQHYIYRYKFHVYLSS
ncbi:hypothetical protein B4144_4303 [Bacillus atrophaeus]|nr:hypothetical protein B4144_4303 [Bacillus atrophaeus]